MVDYAIGDVQGCYDPLMRLLDHIQFNEHRDRLWFVGDLVNRGPHSLAVLRFIKQLPRSPLVVLGNHDLHLLSLFRNNSSYRAADDTLDEVIQAPDAEELCDWLQHQRLLYYDEALSIVMVHAGIAPLWDLPQALMLAHELEGVLQHQEQSYYFFKQMYGNTPALWCDNLEGISRWRVICNYFTRMRFCDEKGELILEAKEAKAKSSRNFYPWYDVPKRKRIMADIVFGHWAALEGHCAVSSVHAIDTGCVWGKRLTALRLQDKQRFSVAGLAI